MKNVNWKLPVIIICATASVVLMCIFGIQSAQNRAIGLEEAVYTANSDINVYA